MKGITNKSVSLNATQIKLIAVIFMVLEHVADTYVTFQSPVYILAQSLGYVTAPVMCFFIAEGYRYSRSLPRYVIRMAILAIVSHFPYCLWVYGKIVYIDSSIAFTLMCGLIAVCVYCNYKIHIAVRCAVVTALVFVTTYSDWGGYAVLLPVIFAVYGYDKEKMMRIFWCFAGGYAIIVAIMTQMSLQYTIPYIVSPFIVTVLLKLYNGTKGGNIVSKWAFYILYPLQFLILWLLK